MLTVRPSAPSAARVHGLDPARLRAGIGERRQELAGLEMALVAVCEREAIRHANAGVRVDNRETWDRLMWQRYLAAATEFEPDYAPRMRRLLRQIDQLERLLAMPIAA